MKKHRSTQSTVQPPEWNGKNFNVWVRSINREYDKIYNTQVSSKIKVN